MGRCFIIGAGEQSGEIVSPGEGDLVIACDGGFETCRRRGIDPDLVVGDFDSLGYVPTHPGLIRLKPEKDETDTGWALAEGWKRGFREFIIYGGTGGRISHTIANIQLLTDLASKGGKGILVGRSSWYRVICNEEITFDEQEKGYLSVFCLGERAEGVFERGLKYELRDAVLTKEYPIGVSNEFIGVESRVSVRKGTLLLIREAQNGGII